MKILAIGDTADNIFTLKKFAKKSAIHLITFPLRFKIKNYEPIMINFSSKIQAPGKHRNNSKLVSGQYLLLVRIKIVTSHILNTSQILNIK